MQQKKVYFVSDAHLGSRMVENPDAHEKRIVDWLNRVKADTGAIYLLGDMFDFWYEYKTVVPKGHVRFLGKLAELVDSGIEIHFFVGNHDLWTFGYLEKEVGLIVHKQPETIRIGNKTFYLAHGDGIHSQERGFKIIRKIFHSKTCQRLFRLIPPQIGQNFGFHWSKKNRERIKDIENKFLGEDKEDLVVFAKEYIKTHDVDFLVFGHRHIALDLQLKNNSRVVILGDFVGIFSCGVFDGNNFWLEFDEE
ncbi:MAG: UDP-2,3-diacylglucosamine diphosphatase [Prevotellaceae bacterium]|jgi:UDP-2,3-diacylglucosamine hydrolase|nr:UDP-2,3-diacylglucosamine diphosphatase [Prevotellaceae bacterium]